MIETILKQHTYKTGSIKKLIECRSSETNEVLCYLVKFTDRLNRSLCNMNFHYLNKALEWYKKLCINYNQERLLTKRGRLTIYALICNYIEEHTFPDGSYKELWMDCNTIYVQHFNYYRMPKALIQSFSRKDIVQARKFYDSIVVKP